MAYADHAAHQMRRSQPHKGNQARLCHGGAGGQRHHSNQTCAHGRQGQPQAGGGGFTQRQPIEHARQPPRTQRAQRPGAQHQRTRSPADKSCAAQSKGLHGLQDVGVAQLQHVAHRTQHHTHNHACQQQAQAVLHALGQHQRQQHGRSRTGKGHACHAQPLQPLHAHGCGTAEHHGRGPTQRSPRGAAQQVRIRQRVAKQSLRHGTGQPQQGTGQPRAQSARQANVPDNLLRHRIAVHAQHALPPGTAHAGAQQQQTTAGGQQQHRQPTAAHPRLGQIGFNPHGVVLSLPDNGQ